MTRLGERIHSEERSLNPFIFPETQTEME